MLALHEHYPAYGFDRHKGYPTKAHLAALETAGISPVHGGALACQTLAGRPRGGIAFEHGIVCSPPSSQRILPDRWLAPYPPRAQPGGGAGDARCGITDHHNFFGW